MRKLICFLFLFTLACGATFSFASEPARELSPSGEMTFIVLRGQDGFQLGSASHSWKRDGDRYSMSLRLEPIPLIRALYHFYYTQTCEGSVTKNGLRPDWFRVTQKNKQASSASFDWINHQIIINRKNKQTFFDLNEGTKDILTAWHVVETGGLHALTGIHTFVTNHRVYVVDIESLGDETLILPIGKVQTTHLLVLDAPNVKQKRKVHIDFWISPQFHDLPVRIILSDPKQGKLDFKLQKAKIK